MFAKAFQKGENGIEIFSPSGTDPLRHLLLKNESGIEKKYDRYIKGNCLILDQTSISSSISCPSSSSKSLGIFQPWFCLQLNLPKGKGFSIELIISEQNGRHHRLHFSTSFRGWDANELHARIAWPRVHEDLWVTYIINLEELCRICFRSNFHSLDQFTIYSCCNIRKVFSLPERMTDIIIPAPLDFPIGVAAEIFLINIPERIAKSSHIVATSGKVASTAKTVIGKGKRPVVTSGNVDVGIIGTKKRLAATVTASTVNTTSKPIALALQEPTQKSSIQKSTASETTPSLTDQQKEQILNRILEFDDDEGEGDNQEGIDCDMKDEFQHYRFDSKQLYSSHKQDFDAQVYYSDEDDGRGDPSLTADHKSERHEVNGPSEDKDSSSISLKHAEMINDLHRSMSSAVSVSSPSSTRIQDEYTAAGPIRASKENEEDAAVEKENELVQRLLEKQERNPWQTVPSPPKSPQMFVSSPLKLLNVHSSNDYKVQSNFNTTSNSPISKSSRPATATAVLPSSSSSVDVSPKKYHQQEQQQLSHALANANTNTSNSSAKTRFIWDDDVATTSDDVKAVHGFSNHESVSEHYLYPSSEKSPKSSLLYHQEDDPRQSLHSVSHRPRIAFHDLKQDHEPVSDHVFSSIREWKSAITELVASSAETEDVEAETIQQVQQAHILCSTLEDLERQFWQSFGRDDYERQIGYFQFEV